METLKKLLPFLLLLAFSIVVIVQLVPTTHPYGGIRLPLDATEVIQHSRALLHDLGVNDRGLSADIQFRTNQHLLRQIQATFGIEQSNALMRDSIAVYYWTVDWKKEQWLNYSFGGGESSEKHAQNVVDSLRADISFQFDTRGGVLEFNRKIPDSTKLPSLADNEAKVFAAAFLKKYSTFGKLTGDTGATSTERKVTQPFRTDYEFVWKTSSPVVHNPVNATVTIAGNIISKFEADPVVPEQFAKDQSDTVMSVVVALLYVAFGIAMVVIAFQRFRSYEIGFRLAVIVGVVAGVLADVEVFLSVRNEMSWEILLPLIFAPLFVGGSLILVWAVCETVVRESWKEKFISLDLLTKGYFVHSRIGLNIVRGLAVGSAGFALLLVLTKIGGALGPLWTTSSNDNPLHVFDLSFSWLYVLGNGIYSTLYVYAFCILFGLSFLRKYVSSSLWLVFAGAVMVGIMHQMHLHPIPIGIVVSVLVGTVSVWTFVHYDALASFLSLFTFNIAQNVAGLFIAGNTTYTSSAITLVILTGIVLVLAIAMAYRKEESVDFDEITPAFARHITERQRLQQELEIARSVQMSFLPKKNPVSSRLDIASRCAPALEVGGDYFDFIDLGGKKLGIAVGDVSGKGTQAAFFMTLTKGFLNALARVSNSPSTILTQVNSLFYENVERGVFISMVYGVFDTGRNILTLARAGHNPVIMRKSRAKDVQVVNPTGLALGLDQGDTFSRSIKEVKIKFQPGDLFVFYTDGFPEAMNKAMEEFGEERLCRTVEKYTEGTAEQIMENIFKDMKQFTGKAKQHDDMTIVVVKIA